SSPEYRKYNCCRKPECSIMCSGNLQGITKKELEIWLKIMVISISTLPLKLVHFLVVIVKISLWMDSRILQLGLVSHIISSQDGSTKGKKPKPDSASTSVEKVLETEETT
ncbi:28_t:CDS:2, partial [Rhizophagus irregularis]